MKIVAARVVDRLDLFHTSLGMPMIDAVLIEHTNPRHPFGARGVGEVPIVPPMAAFGNAT
jgi:CO/xanthine dehydrogenase Mo-binding subunit